MKESLVEETSTERGVHPQTGQAQKLGCSAGELVGEAECGEETRLEIHGLAFQES